MNLFHIHRWVIVSAMQGTYTVLSGDGTVVLYRCRECGDNRTKTIDGRWTVAELAGER